MNKKEFFSIHLMDLDTGIKSKVEKERNRMKLSNPKALDPVKFLETCEAEGCWLTDDMYLNAELFKTGAIFKFYKVKEDEDIHILTGGCGNSEEHKQFVWPLLTESFSDIEVSAPDIPYIAWHREISPLLEEEDYKKACALNYFFSTLFLRS